MRQALDLLLPRPTLRASATARCMWPFCFQSGSKRGDWLGMRMYCWSVGDDRGSQVVVDERAVAVGVHRRRRIASKTPIRAIMSIHPENLTEINPGASGWSEGRPSVRAESHPREKRGNV